MVMEVGRRGVGDFGDGGVGRDVGCLDRYT
jgi:hypothetical protein